jgi:hypothetical protein
VEKNVHLTHGLLNDFLIIGFNQIVVEAIRRRAPLLVNLVLDFQHVFENDLQQRNDLLFLLSEIRVVSNEVYQAVNGFDLHVLVLVQIHVSHLAHNDKDLRVVFLNKVG